MLFRSGALTLIDGGRREAYFVAGGFVEVSNDKVLVLADAAEPVAGIDVEAARRRAQEATERLRALTAGDARFELEQAAVRRELARVTAAAQR